MHDFASLINQLFATYRKRDGSEYSNREVARELDRQPSYILQLRRGQIANPGRDTLLGLCKFFNVEPSYFFPEITQTPLLTYEQQLDKVLESAGYEEEDRTLIKSLILKRIKRNTEG